MGPPALRQLVEAKLRAAVREDAENAALRVETALRIAQQRLGFRADFGKRQKYILIYRFIVLFESSFL
jgi:hypothetical protein